MSFLIIHMLVFLLSADSSKIVTSAPHHLNHAYANFIFYMICINRLHHCLQHNISWPLKVPAALNVCFNLETSLLSLSDLSFFDIAIQRYFVHKVYST